MDSFDSTRTHLKGNVLKGDLDGDAQNFGYQLIIKQSFELSVKILAISQLSTEIALCGARVILKARSVCR